MTQLCFFVGSVTPLLETNHLERIASALQRALNSREIDEVASEKKQPFLP
jgi:hypothetical protein